MRTAENLLIICKNEFSFPSFLGSISYSLMNPFQLGGTTKHHIVEDQPWFSDRGTWPAILFFGGKRGSLYILPTSTMHYYRGNPSNLQHTCIVWSPLKMARTKDPGKPGSNGPPPCNNRCVKPANRCVKWLRDEELVRSTGAKSQVSICVGKNHRYFEYLSG